MIDRSQFTVVFEGDLRTLPFNPMTKSDTPFGRVITSGYGNAFDQAAEAPANLNRASWPCVLFGHKFQPRYDTGEPRPIEVSGLFASELIRLAEARALKTYRCDVCERCGSVVQREGVK